MSDPTCHLVPVDAVECPQAAGVHDVLLDKHWSFVPFRGLVFAKLRHDYFPQCNDDQAVVNVLNGHLREEFPDVETLFVPRAFIPVTFLMGELSMGLPRDRGLRSWHSKKVQ